MPTPYSEIDDIFLSDITDDTFFLYTEAERQKILDGLRNKAITRFKACKYDLNDRVDTTYETVIDEETEEEEIVIQIGQFNETLTDEEKLIIATAMRKYWLNDKIYNLNLLKQRMSTKDWKISSQAEHLLRLNDLHNQIESEISRMIVDYTLYTYSSKKEN